MTHPIDLNHITPEQAIQGTIEMWSDMRDALGETPTAEQRFNFKHDWICEHGYKSIISPRSRTSVTCNCFLCECAESQWYHAGFKHYRCNYCPICWPDYSIDITKCRSNILDYTRAPIPDILAYIQDEKNRRYK